MKPLIWIIVCLLVSSCASYRAYEKDESRPAPRRLKKKDLKGLIIAAEDYSPEKKSTRYFDRDLRSLGYVPIYICLYNSTDYEFTIKKGNITFRYEDTTEAKVVDVEEVIAEAQSSPAIALVTFPFLIPPFFIWSSISDANYDLEKDYNAKAFHGCNLIKDEKLFGFIFVKIPEDKGGASIKDSLLEIEVIKKAKKGEMAEPLTCKLSVSEN